MSKKTVVITTCNGCNGTLYNEEPAHEYVIVVGRKQYEIDLCGVCNEPFSAYFTAPAPPSKKVPAKRGRPRKNKDEATCSMCDRVFANAHGLQVHIARSHKKK